MAAADSEDTSQSLLDVGLAPAVQNTADTVRGYSSHSYGELSDGRYCVCIHGDDYLADSLSERLALLPEVVDKDHLSKRAGYCTVSVAHAPVSISMPADTSKRLGKKCNVVVPVCIYIPCIIDMRIKLFAIEIPL